MRDYEVSANGDVVVYVADQNTLNRAELYIVNLANPGLSTRLNVPLTVNRDVIDFAISPDGSKVVYRADQDADDVYELYLVNVATPGAAVKLNSSLVAGGWVRAGFSFSPDGANVVYRADQDVFDTVDVVAFHIRPDGAHVAYIANQESAAVYELYDVELANPGVVTKLNPAMAGDGVFWFEYSLDSTHVIYAGGQDSDIAQLYSVGVQTPAVSTRLNGSLTAGGEVWDFAIVP